MQIERSATSISWIPSASLPAPLKIPFQHGDLRALTQARVAETPPGTFTAEQLSELAQGHHREDSRTGR
jgi:hypothetical protein